MQMGAAKNTNEMKRKVKNDDTTLIIRTWYASNYPEDELKNEIRNKLTFGELMMTMTVGHDFYPTLGVADSLIRERIFTKMSEIYNVSYDEIYDTWLYGGNK